MPRSSPFRIILTPGERKELETRARKLTSPYRDVIRAKIVLLDEQPRGGRPTLFSPSIVVQVKALACELPHRLGLPLSRMSLADIRQEVTAQGIVAQVSGTTV